MSEQLTLTILADAEQQQREALDRHRQHVQTWFDELSVSDKDQLAEWMTRFEWDTCVALSAAAGDYRYLHVANGK